MAGQTMWLVVIVLVVAAAVIGFYLGRVSAGGARQKAAELEQEVERQKSELKEYRREVDAHFDQTASLFVSMAGSYKALFEHLNSGYEKLAGNEGRDLFRERIASLLMDGRQDDSSRYLLGDDKPAADETAPVSDTAPEHDEPTAPTSAFETDTASETQATTDDTPAVAASEVGQANEAEAEGANEPTPTPVDDTEAIKAAAAEAAVAPEAADGDAGAVRDASGVPLVAAGADGAGEDKRATETVRV